MGQHIAYVPHRGRRAVGHCVLHVVAAQLESLLPCFLRLCLGQPARGDLRLREEGRLCGLATPGASYPRRAWSARSDGALSGTHRDLPLVPCRARLRDVFPSSVILLRRRLTGQWDLS